ncbi:cupredoxin domain-containing protein [Caldinitratiruptor microaerophilus]|uniref:EfeO-type cupredoxin-like domain-containing protein n=1 Tax=Caldinitratiruptor microaerophilus TaxID=671077 RepID=A0AA35CMF7_9FIRM|nr:cupredoxin domain-containing protein [Caldinitratiruptor microaerophilus]BDG61179.1 hypothetical protein caldi_22690 [Caldinitratiruptor microaerophilus]
MRRGPWWVVLVALAALGAAGAVALSGVAGATGWGPGYGRWGFMGGWGRGGPPGFGWMRGMRGAMWGRYGPWAPASADSVPAAPASPGAERAEVTARIVEWKIEPATVRVQAGRRLVLTVRNDGTVPHNFAIPDLGVRLVDIAPGGSRTVELNADEPGTYEFFCDIPGHAQLGQRGTLEIGEA